MAGSARRHCGLCGTRPDKDKAEGDQQDRGDPGKWKCTVQPRKGRVRSKRCADPQYAKGTGAKHGAGGRQRGVSGTAQGTGRNFIQIAERFKKQNTQYAHTGFADYGFFAGKQAGKEAAEHHNGDNEPKAAQGGKEQAKPKNFSAAVQLAGGVVLVSNVVAVCPKAVMA